MRALNQANWRLLYYARRGVRTYPHARNPPGNAYTSITDRTASAQGIAADACVVAFQTHTTWRTAVAFAVGQQTSVTGLLNGDRCRPLQTGSDVRADMNRRTSTVIAALRALQNTIRSRPGTAPAVHGFGPARLRPQAGARPGGSPPTR